MKKVVSIIVIAFVVAVVWTGYFAADVFLASQAGDEQMFVVGEGEGVNQVSNNLAAAGLITNQFNFETYVWLLRRESRLQAGEYRLNPAMSLRQLTNLITYGRGTNEKKVTIIEGWNNREIAKYLAKELLARSSDDDRRQFVEDFLAAARQPYPYEFLASKPADVDVEGYLFPDTYQFFITSQPADIITVLLENFDRKLTPELQEQINKQGKTIHEVVTLASIVEEEVATEQDRRLVADIFSRRLEIGMALQADSTVNYVTGGNKPAVSGSDLQTDSPYNTYRYRGLPPGPISNPGLDTIIDVVNPLSNDYWFFLTTPDGQVIYSKTLAQHNAAKQKYLR